MFGRILFELVIVLLGAVSGTVCAAERPILREVAVFPESNGARIEIRADQPLVYRSYLMPQLSKWVIDLPGVTTGSSGDQARKMKTLPLERITVRQKEVNGDQFTRIGFDVTGTVDFLIKADPADKSHLVVVITPSGAAPQRQTAVAGSVAPPAAAVAVRQSGTVSAAGLTAKAVTSVSISADSIRIEADGRLIGARPMLLNGPGRLVLDLAGLTTGLEKIPIPANRFGIVRCRFGKSADKLRIVFEVNGNSFPAFQLQEINNGVEIFPRSPDRLL